MNAKLTAYALNELPPDERAALEAEMETNPALRAEAEEMKKFCTVLHDEVSAADKVALTVEQRVRVLREFTADSQPKKTTRSIWRHPAFWVPTAIAACTTVMLVINLNRPPSAKEMEQLVEMRLAERTAGSPSSADIRVTMERTEKAVRPESQTPAPGKPEMPALVAANSPVSLGTGGGTLPPMPAPTVADRRSVVLPQALEGTSVTFSGVVTNPVLAANEPAPTPTPMAINGNYGSANALAGKLEPATRGIEIGASRPQERYNFSPEKLGEVPAEMTISTTTAETVNHYGWLDHWSDSADNLNRITSGGVSQSSTSAGRSDLAFGSSVDESPLRITPGGIVKSGADTLTLSGANTYTGGIDLNGGVTMSTGDPATNVITNSVLTDGSVPILGEIPIAGRAFQSTGGIVKSGAGTLALGNSTAMPQPTSVPTGAEPFAPGFAMGVFGGGVLPESEKNDPLSPQGNTSLSMATASTSANGSSIAPVATRGGNISFKNGNIAGTGATTPPANDDFALADAAKAAPKMTSVAGTVLDAPADLAAIASTTPTPAPTAKPMEAKPAAPSRAVTLARVTDNTPEAAGAVPASPAAAAPMAGVAGAAAAPAATTAAPVVGDPYIALNEPKKRVMQESLVRDEDESEVLQVTRDKQLKELKQLQDGAERSRTKLMRSAGGETYTPIYENPFLQVAQQPLSTFSIDVDTASYANVRRFLNNGQRPPADAVRLEELINYFPYSYEPPAEDGAPFSVTVDMAEAPWQPMHRLARIALKGREIRKERGAANFVFLVDVSGSMDEPDKLPLVKQSLRMLTEQIKDTDRVAIVTYAGESGVALTSTPGSQRKKIQNAIEKLGAGGSTNGAGGIRMAYQQATENFVQEGVNRVILCTDGDFNVGLSSPEELEKLIAEKAKSRVFLSVLGYGTGNLKDRTMETLADKGNGNYAYIDSLSEARKVLVDQMNATLVTIAKDVKIQVEFNPTQVAAYRLLGYENRALAKEDFNNDRKDAGEIGAGHTVTALYEIVPAGARLTSPDGRPMVDNLKYAPQPATPAAAAPPAPGGGSPSKETMTVKLRYKQPEGDKSQLIEVPVIDKEQTMANAPRDFVFAAGVTGFGMLLRNSQYSSELTWDMVRDMAIRGKGEDPLGYRGEFLQLIDKARGLTEGRE